MIEQWKRRVRQLKTEVVALYLACRDPRTPWYAKAVAGCVVAYALSPIDLIPDPIPVLGYLDDLLLVPLGIWLSICLVPAAVMEDCRKRADSGTRLPGSRVAAIAIVGLWLVAATMVLYLVHALWFD